MKGIEFTQELTSCACSSRISGQIQGRGITVEHGDGVGLQMTPISLALRPFRVQASRIAIAYFHTPTFGGSRAFIETEVIQGPEGWLVKVVSTLFATSRSKDSCLGYLRDKLTPLIAFEIIKRYNNPILGLEFLQFSRLNLNLSHCFWTYSLLLRSLCQMGLHDLATETYDYMKSDGHSFDSALLGFLVTSYAQVFKFDTVKKFLSEVEREDSGINSFVYNNLLNELVKRNRVHEAIGLLKDHLAPQSPPDTWTFNILIRGLCRLGEVDKAFEIFDNMGSFGCFPDIVTYNTLINGLCKANDVVKGCDLLMEVKSRDSCSPDVVTYTSIISGFCKLGQMQEASVLFEEMIVSGINPNVITFNVLIDGFGKSGNMVAAKSMYENMISFNCRPDVVTFTSLIDGYCGTGEVSLGLKLWDVMKTEKICPNIYTYVVLINALCRDNRLHEARDLLKQLKCSNIIPKPFMYNPVIDGFCKAGNVDEANVIVAEMVEKKCYPDKVTFTILIIGHSVKGRMSEAINLFDKMLAIGCFPDNITLGSLISCLLKAGMSNEASRVIQMASEDLSFLSYQKTVPFKANIEIPVAA